MIKSYFRDIWWELKSIPENALDFIKARDSYHWFELKYNIIKLWGEIIHLFYCIKHGVYNLYRWFNVIWFDRNWDHHFFKIMMEKKFQLMEEFFKSNKTHIHNASHYAKQIAYCRKLINMSIDPPTPNADKYYEKYGFDEFESVPIKFDSLGKPTLFKMEQRYRSPEERAEFSDAIFKDFKYEENINKRLFNFLNKNLNKFWD